MTGEAGTVTVHNARCVHGGGANHSTCNRPLLLNTYAAASAQMLPAGTNPLHAQQRGGTYMVRGRETNEVLFDTRPIPMAPNFSQGYTPGFIDAKDKQ